MPRKIRGFDKVLCFLDNLALLKGKNLSEGKKKE